MLEPLLRSSGNMASSAAAAAVLGAPAAISVISQIGQRERYRQEASWVLANLEAAKRWTPSEMRFWLCCCTRAPALLSCRH